MTSIPTPTHKPLGFWRFWLGLAVSAAFLTMAIRQVDWARTVDTLVLANLSLIGLGAGLLVVTFIVFAVRWRVLLSSSARLSVGDTFLYIMIGYLANTVLPLRLGDVARAVLMGRRHGIGASLVFGSVILERVLDVLTMLVLALGLSLVLDIPPVIRASMMTFAGGALVAFAGLFLLARNEDRLPRLVLRLPAFVPRMLAERLVGLVTQFTRGLRTLRSGQRLGQALLLSGLAWGVAGTGMMVWVKAFHLPAPWYAGLFVLAVINLGGAIPSSPGAIGVYDYLAMLALSVWIMDKSTALGYAIGTHGVNILINIVMGAACLAREGIALRSIGDLAAVVPEPTHFMAETEPDRWL